MHVVGAGLAGLSSAVHLAAAGRRVRLYEASKHCGGRCRSFFDPTIERHIDNGNHLLLSGNRDLFAYLERIGAAASLAGPATAEFHFLDLETGDRWSFRPGGGRLPWWIFSQRRRIPGSRPGDYLQGLRLACAGDAATVAQCLDRDSPLYRRFWEPMAVAVLNAAAEEGAAPLLWAVVRETFGRGEAACRPRMARHGLTPAFVDPALAFLSGHHCQVQPGRRLRAVGLQGDGVTELDFGEEKVPVEKADCVVLALPPAAAAAAVPGLQTPGATRAIVNGHFRLDGREGEGEPALLGLVGGVCQWLFVRGDVASVTVSAADWLMDEPSATIARRLWPEVAKALRLGNTQMPPHRIVKEKRATFAQIPAETARRPPTATHWRNLFLAGDWTDTGLPATMEGAVKSGRKAADAVRAFTLST